MEMKKHRVRPRNKNLRCEVWRSPKHLFVRRGAKGQMIETPAWGMEVFERVRRRGQPFVWHFRGCKYFRTRKEAEAACRKLK